MKKIFSLFALSLVACGALVMNSCGKDDNEYVDYNSIYDHNEFRFTYQEPDAEIKMFDVTYEVTGFDGYKYNYTVTDSKEHTEKVYSTASNGTLTLHIMRKPKATRITLQKDELYYIHEEAITGWEACCYSKANTLMSTVSRGHTGYVEDCWTADSLNKYYDEVLKSRTIDTTITVKIANNILSKYSAK